MKIEFQRDNTKSSFGIYCSNGRKMEFRPRNFLRSLAQTFILTVIILAFAATALMHMRQASQLTDECDQMQSVYELSLAKRADAKILAQNKSDLDECLTRKDTCKKSWLANCTIQQVSN